MRRREPLVIGSVVAWVSVFWFGLCAFMMGWGPEDLSLGHHAGRARPRPAVVAKPDGLLGKTALRHTLDS